MLYGLNWAGSKSGIADELLAAMPKAKYFVDLFCGGCAMTHAALMSGKYEIVIANDLKPTAQFFKDALLGKIENIYELVTKEDFYERKKTDIKVASCWSYGGSARTYAWAEEDLETNYELYNAITLPDQEDRKFALLAAFKIIKEQFDKGILQSKSLEGRQKVKTVNTLNRLARLAQYSSLADKLVCSQKDYREVEIPADSVVYCDIPYKECETYDEKTLDFDAFYEWCESRDFPVFVSEYDAPLSCVWEKTKRIGFGQGRKIITEKLFVQKKFARLCKANDLFSQEEAYG